MIYKNKLHQSIRYWNKQTERVLSEEFVPKTPLYIILNAIEVKQRHIAEDLRIIRNSF